MLAWAPQPSSLPKMGLARSSELLCSPPRGRVRASRRPRPPSMAFLDPVVASASAAATVGAMYAWEVRPTGEVLVEAALQVRASNLPGAGLGLFAREDIPSATLLGTYSGKVWQGREWLRFKGATLPEVLAELTGAEPSPPKMQAQELARAYVWRLQNGCIIDPTDNQGLLLESGVSWLLPGIGGVPVLFSRINEPGRGLDTNVVTEEVGNELRIYAERDIGKGEELYIDYGTFYDRSSYGK